MSQPERMAGSDGFYHGVLASIVGVERALSAAGDKRNEEEVLDNIEEWLGSGNASEEERAEFMRRANLMSPEQNDNYASATVREGVDKISRRLFDAQRSPLDEFEMSP